MTTPATTFICCHSGADNSRELTLSAQLQLPLIQAGDMLGEEFPFYLQYDSAGLTLYQNAPGAPGGLCIDFSNPDLLRRTADKLKQQNICKAVGLKGKNTVHVLDAMTGLGRDAWLLASGGAEVQMLERAPIVFALLQDAFMRGQPQLPASTSPLRRMQLRQADFLEIADDLPMYDVVYLDPMFPSTNKQARAKKDMFLLQQLLGESSCDEAALLQVARAHARRRVVVKRAKLSPHLAGQRPDIEYKGSANRFDVYLCHAPAAIQA